MANNIVFEVFADTKDFQNKFKSLNATAKKITRNATIAFAAFGGAIALTTKLAKDQQKVMNQTRAVIKSTGGVAGFTAEAVFKLGKEMQNITTFGDEVVISATNMLLTFKEISAETMPRATKAVLDMSVAMNQGLKESAIQLGKALNDPILGLTAMRRVGIQFTKSQEDQIKTLTKAGNIMKAQSLILEELESQFGGSAEAAREGLGAINALRNSLGDLGENIALVIAPLIERLANSMTKFIDIVKDNKAIVAFIATLLVLGVVISGLLVVVAGVVTAVTTIGATFSIAIAGTVVAIGALTAALTLFRGETEETKEIISGQDGLFPKASTEAEAFTGFLAIVKEKMTELKEETFLLGAAITAGLLGQGGFGGDIGEIDVSSEGEEAQPPAFLAGLGEGINKLKEEVGNLKKLGEEVASTFVKGFGSAFTSMVTGAKSVGEAFKDLGKSMLTALLNYIGEWIAFQILSKVTATATSFFTEGIAVSIASAWAPAAALASLATLGSNAKGATTALITTTALSQALAVPKGFARGSSGIEDDTIGMFNKREIVIPSSFSDGIRSGDLSLSGGDGSNSGSGVTVDLRGAQINGLTDEVVEEIFTKASENIANGTLAFAGG